MVVQTTMGGKSMKKLLKYNLLLILGLSLMFVITGCGFGGEQAVHKLKENEPPQEITYVEDEEALENEQAAEEGQEQVTTEEEAVEFVSREIYLFDEQGYVVPQTLNLPKTKEVAKQSLEYLVQSGPVTELLPNGFKAVLPPGTEIYGVNLKEDGTIIADFSQEFTNYQSEEEMKILQAITWTLTQFDTVEKVQIRINGHDQPVMPVNGSPIGDGFSRANGINLDNGEVVDISKSKSVTLYFLAQNGDSLYYVPVTRRINEEVSETTAVINELIKGPDFASNLVSEFHPNIKLLDEPNYEDGTITLNFNEAVLGNLQGTAISDYLLNSLVLSLTEQEGIENVSLFVNGEAEVYNQEGEVISAPVSRPENVNTIKF